MACSAQQQHWLKSARTDPYITDDEFRVHSMAITSDEFDFSSRTRFCASDLEAVADPSSGDLIQRSGVAKPGAHVPPPALPPTAGGGGIHAGRAGGFLCCCRQCCWSLT